jgi:hypothetical protein
VPHRPASQVKKAPAKKKTPVRARGALGCGPGAAPWVLDAYTLTLILHSPPGGGGGPQSFEKALQSPRLSAPPHRRPLTNPHPHNPQTKKAAKKTPAKAPAAEAPAETA